MRRRALLAALVPLTAGCFSGTRAQSDQPDETATPTETPEPGLSDDQQEALERINAAENLLREAVYIYAGGVSNDLLGVSADTPETEFDDRSILLKLSDAQTAVNDAERAAVTDEQVRTVERLQGMGQFLKRATDLQAWLIEGHEALPGAHEALEDGDDESTVLAELDAVEGILDEASRPLEVVTEDVDSSVTEATDAVGREEFEHKRTQFEHEHEVLKELHDAMSTIQSARNELDTARAKADDGDYYSAENAADRAADTLDDIVDRLEDLEENLPSRADAFEDPVKDVLAVARDYADEADDLYHDYS
jgi:DNA repair exonuclease SbcCD ATPase subunit